MFTSIYFVKLRTYEVDLAVGYCGVRLFDNVSVGYEDIRKLSYIYALDYTVKKLRCYLFCKIDYAEVVWHNGSQILSFNRCH